MAQADHNCLIKQSACFDKAHGNQSRVGGPDPAKYHLFSYSVFTICTALLKSGQACTSGAQENIIVSMVRSGALYTF